MKKMALLNKIWGTAPNVLARLAAVPADGRRSLEHGRRWSIHGGEKSITLETDSNISFIHSICLWLGRWKSDKSSDKVNNFKPEKREDIEINRKRESLRLCFLCYLLSLKKRMKDWREFQCVAGWMASDLIYHLSDPEVVWRCQHFFGVRKLKQDHSSSNGWSTDKEIPYEISNRLWFTLFKLGSLLGEELFYFAFFPLWFWNFDAESARFIYFVWAFVMWVGQVKIFFQSMVPNQMKWKLFFEGR